MTGSARYLYAIGRSVDPARVDGITGLEDRAVDVVTHRGLGAVVSEVALDEYGEDGLRANLERLDWLERVARRHDSVVQELATMGPIAPLRLATICLDDAGVRDRLDEWHDALHQVLDRVEGRLEWSVKVYAPAPPAEPSPTGAVSGADYLRSKKAATEARVAAQETSRRAGEEIHAELSEATVASRRLSPQDPQLSGRTETMLLNGAYLVPDDESELFDERVRQVAADHPAVSLECGGPWPPYSFATLEQT